MAIDVKSFLQIILPKKKTNPKGVSSTSTFNPNQTQTVLTIPDYRDHLTDIFTQRTVLDSRELMRDLFKLDPDVSATVGAFLTISDTKPNFIAYDIEGEIDRDGQKALATMITAIEQRSDYSEGFKFSHSLGAISESLRYMLLLRGACAGELVFDKFLVPNQVRHVDMAEINWFEKTPGDYKPEQEPLNSNEKISLDIPNFFVKYYRQNPTEIYGYSPFVGAINTVAARQQVVNDLYRIMQKTGYPRMEITVLEEVLLKNAPASVKENKDEQVQWVNSRLAELAAGVADMRPDSVYVHTDSVEAGIMNKEGPSKAMDVSAIIDVLNAQNQAALKTMPHIIGRGESGVNTASVEARMFSLSADSINRPIADMFEDMFTLALRMQGFEGYIKCDFTKVELRPDLELEPQRLMKQTRLQSDLSLGIITDDEYHLEMHGRPRPDSSEELSGTNFNEKEDEVDPTDVSSNSDPLGRAVASPSNKQARSKTVKNAAFVMAMKEASNE